MWVPASVVLVEHHENPLSTVVQEVYTTPLYLKGKTHSPASVVHELVEMVSDWQEDRDPVSQSSHLLVTTTPELSIWVAHQGVGESA